MTRKNKEIVGVLNKKSAFLNGLRDGIPIGLGYFAVSFSLGIEAQNAGLSFFESFLASFFCNASAGEMAGFTVIAAKGTLFEMALITLIANIRYVLMSFAIGQRVNPKTSVIHRFLIAYGLTDEIFGISIAKPGYLNPFYSYGAILCAGPCWWAGTVIGNIAGNLMPIRLVSAFSVALYGMFLAIIIPAGKKDRIIAALIAISFAASFSASYIPFICDISNGTRIIVLTVVISLAAAILLPHKGEEVIDNGN